MDVPHLLEIRADDLLRDAGPPVEVESRELLRGFLAAVPHLHVDDLRLRGQVDQDEPVPVGSLVDREGTGDEPRDGDGIEPVGEPVWLEDGEVPALPDERGGGCAP